MYEKLTSGSWMTKVSRNNFEVRLLSKLAEIKDMDIGGKSQGSFLTEHLIAYLSGNMSDFVQDQSKPTLEKAIATHIDPLFRTNMDR